MNVLTKPVSGGDFLAYINFNLVGQRVIKCARLLAFKPNNTNFENSVSFKSNLVKREEKIGR